MKIFIDFDDVIFNTYKFKNKFFSIYREAGFTRKEVETASRNISSVVPKSKEKPYSPHLHIKELKKIRPFNEVETENNVNKFLKDLRPYVFSDCLKLLESVSKNDLYLLSYGEINFQKRKIAGSGIGKYFKRIIITKDNKINQIGKISKAENFHPKEDILLLDDRPENLEKIERANRKIITFHVCRPEGRYSHLACRNRDFKVKNFKDVLKIIKKEKMK